MAASKRRYSIHVYLYDLSKSTAKSILQRMLGTQVEGVWHSSVVGYGNETAYTRKAGIRCYTLFGKPTEILDFGSTEIPPNVFTEFLNQLRVTTFKQEHYHVLDHNSNNFTNEATLFLTGKSLPAEILQQSKNVCDSKPDNKCQREAAIRQMYQMQKMFGKKSSEVRSGNALVVRPLGPTIRMLADEIGGQDTKGAGLETQGAPTDEEQPSTSEAIPWEGNSQWKPI